LKARSQPAVLPCARRKIETRVQPPLPAWLLLLAASVQALVLPAAGLAFELKQAGTLQVTHGVQLFAFSTDPTVQEVLSQDFSAAERSSGRDAARTVTVSVNVSQQMLKPGVSLNQLAPGDPQVADLIRAAGANPPPLGDTGDQYDQAALARHMAARDFMPHDTQASRMIDSMSQSAGSSELGMFGPPIPLPCAALTVARPGCPPPPQASPNPTQSRSVGDVQQYVERRKHGQSLFGPPANNNYDTVVVARAAVSGAPEEMTLVAICHPGEDVNEAKKHMAEQIANSVLH
jgi:hypothetical protein